MDPPVGGRPVCQAAECRRAAFPASDGSAAERAAFSRVIPWWPRVRATRRQRSPASRRCSPTGNSANCTSSAGSNLRRRRRAAAFSAGAGSATGRTAADEVRLQDAEALILDVESRALRCPTYAAHFVLPLEIGRPPEHVDVRPLDERGQHVVQVTGGSVVAVQDLESRGALVEHRGDGLTHAPGTLMDRHDDREGGCCQTLGMGLLALEQQRSSNVPQLGALGRSPATTAVHRPTPKPPGVEWPRRPTGCRSRFQLTDNPGIKPSGAERASANDPMVRMRSAHR